MLSLPQGDFRAFIFDCDGTLADNMHLHYRAWSQTLRDHGREFPEDIFYQWGGIPTGEIVRRLNTMFALSLEVEDITLRKERYYREMIPEVIPQAKTVALVRFHHGKTPMAVASGGHLDLVERTLRAVGVYEFFDTVVGAEDYKHGKPHPDPFLTAAARLDVAPQYCLAFEDTEVGAQSARAAGMQCILV